MTQSFRILLFGFTALICGSDPASADWKSFWHQIHVGFHKNNDWPQPFQQADVHDVQKPFEIMKSNGWRLHNTIGNDLFRPGDGSLLSAGHRRLHWIATQAPESRRQVFIMRANTIEETQARIEAVTIAIESFGSDSITPQIFVTETSPPTISGSWATKINRDWMDHMAAPKLPDQSTTGQPGVGASSPSR
ncbi:hypothetical protein N9M41_02090 [Rhodopirellula sp.]|jgi:hypothetical protein|nr:hypothetical protein [Rhodopirellula sp.]